MICRRASETRKQLARGDFSLPQASGQALISNPELDRGREPGSFEGTNQVALASRHRGIFLFSTQAITCSFLFTKHGR